MNIVIILSGGTGERMKSNCPKQYLLIGKKPVITYTLEIFTKRNDIDKLVIVADEKWRDFINKQLQMIDTKQSVNYVSPGTTRQHSIFNALKMLKENNTAYDDIVIIHDAVRPLVSKGIIDCCIDRCDDHDGVMPVIPIKDTVYHSIDGKQIANLLPRSELFAGQSPESFRFGKYYQIHEEMTFDEISAINGSSEIAYKKGLDILLAQGAESNFKITTLEDLKRFELLAQ
ncbi:MAG: 2-C-methyl-D-erythritol 4-phosphate cytidylyltransferase [Dysgonamonadaceae bacterium]|jgi:2-C-methyl-D-erythritol 4-phosphate cytidylyltransferase|nr:2-C-methyl-D-erythritol 4-phosphate cytidylyltransferase [Dysgonamonadaceae bacterium]